MNPLQHNLIEKNSNDNGFEHVLASHIAARHANRALVGLVSGAYQVRFQTVSPSLLPELQRSFPTARYCSEAAGSCKRTFMVLIFCLYTCHLNSKKTFQARLRKLRLHSSCLQRLFPENHQ